MIESISNKVVPAPKSLPVSSALNLSDLWPQAESFYRSDAVDGLLNLRRGHPAFLQDVRLAFYLFAVLARLNRIDDLEELYRELIAQNPNNTSIIYRVMCHQRVIRNSARFCDLMSDYVMGVYRHGRAAWQWQDLYATLAELGRQGTSYAFPAVVAGFGSHEPTGPDGLLSKLRVAEEFLLFYESIRLLQGFSIRFKKVPLWDVEDDAYWDCILNRKKAGDELARLTATGPNVVILLHSPFNKLILRMFRTYSTNSRTIAKSLYKSEFDDGHMLLFQADKSSRLTVFVKAFKHLTAHRGSVMLAPDGATGGQAASGSVLGAPLKLFNGAPYLARSAAARTILIHPDFRPQGIHINVADIGASDFTQRAPDFEAQWRGGLCSALEKVYRKQDAIMSIPPRFIMTL
jgi:hypothetical protein